MQLNILFMTIQLIFISTLTPLNFLAFYKEKIVFCGFLTLQWNTGHADLENLCVVELKEILVSSVVFMHAVMVSRKYLTLYPWLHVVCVLFNRITIQL